jgi:hypothetical protein
MYNISYLNPRNDPTAITIKDEYLVSMKENYLEFCSNEMTYYIPWNRVLMITTYTEEKEKKDKQLERNIAKWKKYNLYNEYKGE